jgi:hypothetical protein
MPWMDIVEWSLCPLMAIGALVGMLVIRAGNRAPMPAAAAFPLTWTRTSRNLDLAGMPGPAGALGYKRPRPRVSWRHSVLAFLVFGSMGLIFIPEILILGAWADRSVPMVFNKDMFFFAFGSALSIWALAGLPYRKRPIRKVATALFGAVMVAFSAWSAVGDFLLPRRSMEGRVDATSVATVRGTKRYGLILDGRRFDTTEEVLRDIHKNQLIRAEVAAGSHMILGAQVIEP